MEISNLSFKLSFRERIQAVLRGFTVICDHRNNGPEDAKERKINLTVAFPKNGKLHHYMSKNFQKSCATIATSGT